MDCSKCDGKLAGAKVYEKGGQLAMEANTDRYTLHECFLRRVTTEFKLVEEKMALRKENLKLQAHNKALLFELAETAEKLRGLSND